MILLQIGNSLLTTRVWLLTPQAFTVLFMSWDVCSGCNEHHMLACRVVNPNFR